MSASPSASSKPNGRSLGLDAARALSVMAMVFGHTAEALLSNEARELPLVQTYWGFRGLTAPIFLFVSGWAVVTVVSRTELVGRRVLSRFLPRVALLFAIGLMLRLPAWNLRGLVTLDREVWAHWLGFDALQCIALSLLMGGALLAWLPSWRKRAVALAVVVVGVPLVSGLVAQFADGPLIPLPVQAALRANRHSPFPMFPWAGYFFAGALVGTLLGRLELAGRNVRLGAPVLALVGAAMVAVAMTFGLNDLPLTSPVLFSYRLGQVALIAAGALLLPARMAGALTPVGRSSLTVYVAHLPLIYGWAIFPGLRVWIGRALGVGEVTVIAFALLLFGLGLAWVLRHRPWVSWRARPVGVGGGSAAS